MINRTGTKVVQAHKSLSRSVESRKGFCGLPLQSFILHNQFLCYEVLNTCESQLKPLPTWDWGQNWTDVRKRHEHVPQLYQYHLALTRLPPGKFKLTSRRISRTSAPDQFWDKQALCQGSGVNCVCISTCFVICIWLLL